MYTHFTPNLAIIVELSQQEAHKKNCEQVWPNHLALALLQYKSRWTCTVLKEYGLPVTALQMALDVLSNSRRSLTPIKTASLVTLEASTEYILNQTLRSGDELVLQHAIVGYLLLAILRSNTHTAYTLHKFGVTSAVAKALAYYQLLERF